MRKSRKRGRNARGLILSFLERIASSAFSDFPGQLTDLVGDQHGVYALYKGNRLYYVGLATNLRGRIKNHLRDRHAGRWDRFSLYLIAKARHIKELESLVMRISNPKGNKAKGRLAGASNLMRQLKSSVKAVQNRQFQRLFDGRPRPKKEARGSRRGGPALKRYISRGFEIRGFIGGRVYFAKVRKDGTVYYKGTSYNSPSSAATKALGYNSNGWWFWQFKNAKGEWVRLREMKKGAKPRG